MNNFSLTHSVYSNRWLTTLVTVILMLAPITIKAQIITNDPPVVTAGGTATLTVEWLQTRPISQKWQVSTDGGTRWTDVNGSNYTGVTTNTLIISSVPASFDGYRYRVAYSTAFAGGLYSYETELNVLAPIMIAPAENIIQEGSSTSFYVVDANVNRFCSYQWEYRVNSRSKWDIVTDGGVYSGATTSTLTLTDVPLEYDGFQYQCLVVLCKYPNYSSVPSDNAGTLTVSPIVMPEIILSPEENSITEGRNTSFDVVIEGGNCSNAVSYQWEYRVNSNSRWSNVTNNGIYSGATTSTLTLTNVPIIYDGYQYRCQVYLPRCYNYPLESNIGTLIVTTGVPPIITTTSLPEGERNKTYRVTLTATGTTPITWSIISGSLPAGLSLNPATGVIAGMPQTSGQLKFTVKASNGYNPDDTKEFGVVINEPSVIEIISPTVSFCTIDNYISVPFKKIDNVHPMKYSIIFSDEAKAAGFKDKTSFDNLPADMLLKIDMPAGAPSKTYSGVVRIECEGIDNYKKEYPFTFAVVNNGVVIVNQPPAFQVLCGGAAIALVVDITGNARSFQWSKDGKPISGANKKEYVAETEGNYYVEIMGACGIVKSNVAVVAPSSSLDIGVRVKWGNVLYVENASDKYQRYQWYRNGTAINGATFVYLSEKDGFLGEYWVRCYKPDGSFNDTCPIVFDVRTRSATTNVYPTVLKTNDLLNINIINEQFDSEATVEIYSMLGLQVYSTKINTPVTTVRPTIQQKGIYFVKIKLSSGEVLNEKIIVQ